MFWPTPGESTRTGMEREERWAAGPMPESTAYRVSNIYLNYIVLGHLLSNWGVLNVPPERMTSFLAITVLSVPLVPSLYRESALYMLLPCKNSTPVALGLPPQDVKLEKRTRVARLFKLSVSGNFLSTVSLM